MIRLLRIPELVATTGQCRALIYKRISEKTFPHPIKLGAASAWPSNEIEAVINAQIRGASVKDLKALTLKLVTARKVTSEVG